MMEGTHEGWSDRKIDGSRKENEWRLHSHKERHAFFMPSSRIAEECNMKRKETNDSLFSVS